jgi:hypothetical protein
MSEEKKISLSNDGLSSVLRKREVGTFNIKLSDPDNVVMEIVPSGIVQLERIEAEEDGANSYIAYLFKVIKRQKIASKDKVFFTKNSKFPRTSFNRYSTSAKRIENMEVADKIVISDKLNIWGRTSNFYDLGDHVIHLGMHSEVLFSKIKNIPASTIKQYNLLIRDAWDCFNTQYRSQVDILIEIRKVVRYYMELEIPLEGIRTVTCDAVADADTLEVLLSGKPINSFVTDTAVNEYIDSFKEPLNEGSYNLIKTALTVGANNVTMGLKLLENMNVSKSKPYVYAIFTAAFYSNSPQVRGNAVFTSIGIKNLREQFYINSLNIDKYSYIQTLGSIQQIYSLYLEKEEDKALFLKLSDEIVQDALSAYVGKDVYQFIKTTQV